jgi:hypothetical protein
MISANAKTPHDIFSSHVQFQIPPFQRPYVWNETDQWQPLWDDIIRLIDDYDSNPLRNHFLGAVVIKQEPSETGFECRSVVDGQQRLTTLQLLLDAAQLVSQDTNLQREIEDLGDLVRNSKSYLSGTVKRFKLWPTRSDRVAFEHAMDDKLVPTAEMMNSKIVQAHEFFVRSIREWLEELSDATDRSTRLAKLASALQNSIKIVVIDLGTEDDSQVIFEALNDRGTPLLEADLIKNYVFQRLEKLDIDVDKWAQTYWEDFDGEWWRTESAQGRRYRSRVDIFLQYWLTSKLITEVPTEEVFKNFREYTDDLLSDSNTAKIFLDEFIEDAERFRELVEGKETTALGAFYESVVGSLELGAFVPVLLWITSHREKIPPAQIETILRSLESWAVRRSLLRRTMREVNKFVISIMQFLEKQDLQTAGNAIYRFLVDQDSDTRLWPSTTELLDSLPTVRVYGNITTTRLRMVFEKIEMNMRSDDTEKIPLPGNLELEHVMPQGWRTYWKQSDMDESDCEARDKKVHLLGNLTLVTGSLNKNLSNRPWRDEEAALVSKKGKYPGWGKRRLIGRGSILMLNKQFNNGLHAAAWTETDIEARSGDLSEQIAKIWPKETLLSDDTRIGFPD